MTMSSIVRIHFFRKYGTYTNRVSPDKPSEDAQIRGDAFKTLSVARISYDTEVKDLEREFGRFGPIERVREMNCVVRAPELMRLFFFRYESSRTLMPMKSLNRKRRRRTADTLLLSTREKRI